MKKSSNNTFNEGLNYDLNPITTPNNVLTDAMNASFVTFNGDELALQNDAGNTKILVPGYTDRYVQLSTAFYPLGVKEYGGVLYILSSDGTNIEFGSYPSPEYLTNSSYNGTDLAYDQTGIVTGYKDILYKPTIINDEDFKSGRYVIFDVKGNIHSDDSGAFTNISYFGVPIFYKIRLLQLLSNGFLDLTNDVWAKYKLYKAGTSMDNFYWFNDPRFKYFCPNQFKGKLAVTLEIEPLKTFKLNNVPMLTFDGTQIGTEYTFQMEINAEGTGIINVTSITVQMWLDENQLDDVTVTIDPTTKLGKFQVSLPLDSKEKTIKYQIEPNFTVLGIQYNHQPIVDSNVYTYLEFPEEYRNKYVINGTRLVNTQFDKVKFVKVPSSLSCANKYWTEVSLVDSDNIDVNNNLDISIDGTYVFAEETWDAGSHHVIARFIVVNGYPVITERILEIDDSVLSSFENMLLTTTNEDCSLVTLTINTNIPIDLSKVLMSDYPALQLDQYGIPVPFTHSTNWKQFVFIISPGDPFNLIINNQLEGTYEGYLDSADLFMDQTIEVDTVINYVFVAKPYRTPDYYYEWPDLSETTAFDIIWQAGINFYDFNTSTDDPNNLNDPIPITTSQGSNLMHWIPNKKMYISEPIKAGTWTEITDVNPKFVENISTLTGVWSNISDNVNYVQIEQSGKDTYVFKRAYNSESPYAYILGERDVIYIKGGELVTYPCTQQLTLDRANLAEAITWEIKEGSATITEDGIITTTGGGNIIVRASYTSDLTIFDEITIDNYLYIEGADDIYTIGDIDYLLIPEVKGFIEWEILSGGAEFGDSVDPNIATIISLTEEDIVVKATDVTYEYIDPETTIEHRVSTQVTIHFITT